MSLSRLITLLAVALLVAAPTLQASPDRECDEGVCLPGKGHGRDTASTPPGAAVGHGEGLDRSGLDDVEQQEATDEAKEEATDNTEGTTDQTGEAADEEDSDDRLADLDDVASSVGPAENTVERLAGDPGGEFRGAAHHVLCDDGDSVGPVTYQADRDNETVTLERLSDARSGDQLRAIIWVTDPCLDLEVSLATYELRPAGEGEVLFDAANETLASGQNFMDWARAPDCRYEVRLTVEGTVHDHARIGGLACAVPDAEGPVDVPAVDPGRPVDLPGPGQGPRGGVDAPDPRLPAGDDGDEDDHTSQDGDTPPAPPVGGGQAAPASVQDPPYLLPEAPVLELPPIGYLVVDSRVVQVGEEVVLDASNAYSPVGNTITAYRFLFPDGSWTAWGDEPLQSVPMESPGTYRLGVEVRDATGLASVNSATVVVHVLAPGSATDLLDQEHAIPAVPLPLLLGMLVGAVDLRRLHMARRG